MIFSKLALPLAAVFIFSPLTSMAAPLLGAELASFSALAGGAITTGAYNLASGNLGSFAAITTGANSTSFNNYAGAAITLGANSSSISTTAGAALTPGAGSNPGVSSANDPTAINKVNTALIQFGEAKAALSAMSPGTSLGATMGTSLTLAPGFYSASALTTTAGTTLTLDGGGTLNPVWVFNVAGGVTTGASSFVEIASGTTNASVVWNVGGATTLGANSIFMGSVLSTGAITEGAGATIACGNAFSAAAVILGDGVSTSANNCGGSAKGMGAGLDILNGVAVASVATVSAVPEPQTYAMLLAGLGLIAGFARRRKNGVTAASALTA
jgi:hypothetical protein